MSTATLLPATEPKRDRWGRPLIVPPDGGKAVPYTRCTTVADVLDERRALEAWMQRQVAVGLALRPDLHALAVAADPNDRDALNTICERAREAASATARANLGTALHQLTERLDRGEPVRAPAPFAADLDAYRRATEGFEWLHLERLVVLDEHRVAGTPDRIGMSQRLTLIADLKTGTDLKYSWRAIAVQLAGYAHGRLYDLETHERIPLPDELDQALAVVIHLPAGEGRCELHTVDITAGWEAFRLALEVRRWRQRRNLAAPYHAPPAEVPAVVIDELRARMAALEPTGRAALGSLVAAAMAAGVDIRPSTGATPARVARYAAALSVVEVLDADETATRSALALVTGETPAGGHPLGALVGALEPGQADALARLLDELHVGARTLLAVDDDTYTFPATEVPA